MSTVETRDGRDLVSRPSDGMDSRSEEERSAEVITGGSLVEAICGIGAVVLAIIGLAGLYPVYLLGIATIVLGAALLAQGAAIAGRFSHLLREMTGNYRTAAGAMGTGMTAELLGGVAGIVLGTLALLGVYATTLTPVAAIVFGASLLISSGSTCRLNALIVEGWTGLHQSARYMAREAVFAAAGAQVLVGLGGIVLGIIALVSVHVLSMSLVAMLCLGGAVVLTGAAVSGRMMSLLER